MSACLKASVRLTSIASGGSRRKRKKQGAHSIPCKEFQKEVKQDPLRTTALIERGVRRLALESCFNKHSARLPPRSWFSRAWRERDTGAEGGMGLES